MLLLLFNGARVIKRRLGAGSGGKRGRKLRDYEYTADDIIKMNELLDAARDQRLAHEAATRFKKLQDDNALIALLMSS